MGWLHLWVAERDTGQVTHDGRGFGRSVGEGKECLQAEWAPYHVSHGGSDWMSFGILSEDTASHRAGQSVSSP